MEKINKNTLITDEHGKNLPVVRLKRIVLDNFKNVGHGEIILGCGQESVHRTTEADILGIYGQNGSGKTSVIEALSILKAVMSGSAVPGIYADCIAVDQLYATLGFVFELRYANGIVREASYSFCISRAAQTKEEADGIYKKIHSVLYGDYKVVVFNEKFYLAWEDSSKGEIIIDTSSSDEVFLPITRRKEIVGKGKKVLFALEINKKLANERSQSFIFLEETLKLFCNNNASSVFFQVLAELRFFARNYLHVVDPKSSGISRLNSVLPLFINEREMIFHINNLELIPTDDLEKLTRSLDDINCVLGQLVPGLSIGFKRIAQTMTKENIPATILIFTSCRDGKEIALRNESDGVRKIISVLSLLIAAFNQSSATVAIDKFDNGISEFLLGEILQVFEKSGRGQFIFTAHNLRPLETLDNKFLCFTSTNPQNRYTKLKNISPSDNLRSAYFREIVMCEQEEEMYSRTKPSKITAALKKVGIEDFTESLANPA